MSAEKAKIMSSSPGSITITGLEDSEKGYLEKAMQGVNWITFRSGRVVALETYAGLPDAIEDEGMLPFWSPLSDQGEGSTEKSVKVIHFEKISPYSMPSISIQHLCGYNHTPEYHKKVAQKLIECGFVQVRSKRGTDGKYWEIWIIFGDWMAKGGLKEAIENKDSSKAKIDAAVDFLKRHVSFGTLNVSVQKLAQVMDD